MTDYAGIDDVRAVLTRNLDDPDGTPASLGDDAMQAELDAAQAEVDSWLAGRYSVPFDVPPALVRSLTIDVAAYKATLVYRQSEDLAFGEYDPVWLRYQAALLVLKNLNAGVQDLPVDPTDPGQTAGVARPTVRNAYSGRMFDMDWFGLGLEGGRLRG